jgi:hypothetical protein
MKSLASGGSAVGTHYGVVGDEGMLSVASMSDRWCTSQHEHAVFTQASEAMREALIVPKARRWSAQTHARHVRDVEAGIR